MSVTWADEEESIWLTSVERESDQEAEYEGMPSMKDDSEDEEYQCEK